MSSYRDNMQSSPLYFAILSFFGLDADEAAIYLASLSIGPQPASTLAKKANLKRGHVYNILSRLKDKGMMHESTKKGVRYFDCQSPAALLSLMANKEEEVTLQKQRLLQALPMLEKIRNPLIVQPKVRFFQGVEGLKEVYNDTIIVPKQPIYAFCDFQNAFPAEKSPELHEWMWRYTDRRAARGVWYMGIVNRSPDSDLAYKRRVKQKRKMKILTNINLPVELNIYGDKIALLSTKEDLVGVIIEDAPIATMLRNIHQVLWGLLPDYRPA